jgi:hypothetical protein
LSADVRFSPPSDESQTLAVTVGDDAASQPVTVYATYRQVDAARPPTTAEACPDTAAADAGTRLIDAVQGGPGPYSIARSTSPPLGLYAVCVYCAAPASSDPGAAQALSAIVAGTFRPAGAKRGTAVNLALSQRGTRGRFAGAVAGTQTGRAVIQRRSGGHWRTVKRVDVRGGRFAVTIRVHRRSSYRAEPLGTGDYTSSTSPVVRTR